MISAKTDVHRHGSGSAVHAPQLPHCESERASFRKAPSRQHGPTCLHLFGIYVVFWLFRWWCSVSLGSMWYYGLVLVLPGTCCFESPFCPIRTRDPAVFWVSGVVMSIFGRDWAPGLPLYKSRCGQAEGVQATILCDVSSWSGETLPLRGVWLGV